MKTRKNIQSRQLVHLAPMMICVHPRLVDGLLPRHSRLSWRSLLPHHGLLLWDSLLPRSGRIARCCRRVPLIRAARTGGRHVIRAAAGDGRHEARADTLALHGLLRREAGRGVMPTRGLLLWRRRRLRRLRVLGIRIVSGARARGRNLLGILDIAELGGLVV